MIRLLLTYASLPPSEALRSGLAAVAGLAVVGAAGTSEDLLVMLASTAPTVLLLDLNLPGSDVFALLPALRQQYPQLRLLAQGALTNELYISRALDLGAHGYILHNARPTELVHGLSTVAAGRSFLCTEIGLTLLHRSFTGSVVSGDAARTALGLSKREIEVLGLVAQGLTNAEIARKLFASKRTIETHRQNIITKTQAKNTAALIKLAVRQGLIS